MSYAQPFGHERIAEQRAGYIVSRKAYLKLLSVILLTASVITACSTQPAKVQDQLFNKGMEYYLTGNFELAFKYFESSSNKGQLIDKSFYYMGICMFKSNKLKEAEKFLNKATVLTEDKNISIMSSFSLLKLYTNLGDRDKIRAIQNSLENTRENQLNQILRLDEYHYYMGRSYLETEDTFKAVEYFNRVVEMGYNSSFYQKAKLFQALKGYGFKFGRFTELTNAKKSQAHLENLGITARIITIDSDHFVVAPFNFETKEALYKKITQHRIETEIIP